MAVADGRQIPSLLIPCVNPAVFANVTPSIAGCSWQLVVI
jgi:hypothetical protein